MTFLHNAAKYPSFLSVALLSALCLPVFVGCTPDGRILGLDKHDAIDRPFGLNRQDYENFYNKNKPGEPPIPEAKVTMSPPPIPEVSQILAAPRPPQIGQTQLVSLSVTDDVPLKDVLIELARLADVDIELDASITGGISFRAKEKPFNEVIDRIADLAGLRYSMKNGVLRIERDTPFVQNYPLDFLNVVRNGSMGTSISTNVLGGGEGGGGSGGSGGSSGSGSLNSGSTASISSAINSDFWQSFEAGIKDILAYEPARRISQSTAAPEFEAAGLNTTDQVGAVATPATPANNAAPPSTPAAPAGKGGGGASAATPPPVATPAPASNAPKAPSNAQAANGNTVISEGSNNPFYVINRQAGILTISATSRQQQMIRTYLDKVRSTASAQVLLEAKIVVVSLDSEFQSGIDWNKLAHSNVSISGTTFGAPVTNADAAIKDTFNFNLTDGLGVVDLDLAVHLAEKFGTARTLSSPRLHAMNNQQAVLTFAQNQVYFNIKVDNQTTENTANSRNNISVTSEIKTVPIGIILSMQPSVNPETNEVTLNVRPTLSRIASLVEDPALPLAIATIKTDPSTPLPDSVKNLKNSIPVVEVRELDSMLKLKSGQVMVIGGLMEQTSANTDSGLPGIAGIPWLGNLFKGVSKTDTNSELIIFIRATIVGSNGNYHDTDRKVYEKFTDDPRPIAF